MEYFIKIKTPFTCLIKIENFIQKELKENEFLTLNATLQNNENFIINIEPLEKSENLNFSYKIFVKNENEQLKILSQNIENYNYNNKHFIFLKPLYCTKNVNLVKTTQKYTILNALTTSIATKKSAINLPDIFTFVNEQKINNSTLLTFESLDTKKSKYIVVLLNDEIIFNDYYNQIKLDKKIEILSLVNDITKHAIKTIIENDKINQTIVYKENKPKLVTNEKIIPLVFLQALKINNIKLCKYYLSENLKEKASLNLLKNYFGDFVKVDYFLNNYYLFYKTGEAKVFKYEIIKNKINKIELKN